MGRVVLGLTEEEFWEMTILKINALQSAKELEWDYRFGILAQATLLAAGAKPKDCTPDKFFHSLDFLGDSNTEAFMEREEGAILFEEMKTKAVEKRRLKQEAWESRNNGKEK